MEELAPPAEPLRELKPLVKKRKKAVKLKPFKLTRFDKDLAELVRGGTTIVGDILLKMAVSPLDFQKRLKTLVGRGYFVFDSAESKELRLGWKGYNLFAPKVKRVKKSSLPKPLSEEKTEEFKTEVKLEPIKPSPPIIQEKPALSEKDVVIEVQSTADLADLLEKGSPKGRQIKPPSNFFAERQKQRESLPRDSAPAASKPADTGEALLLEGKEACELCKAKFKLNVKNAEQSKYGHCFCGASFHKDCYESLLDNGGSCIRCGRKLKLMFDKKTEDAVKGIKNVFE